METTARRGLDRRGMNQMEPSTFPKRGAWPARVAAMVLVVLGFIPFAAFLPVGLEMPGLGAQLRDWGTGSLLTVGVGVLAWLSSRRGHWPSIGRRRRHPPRQGDHMRHGDELPRPDPNQAVLAPRGRQPMGAIV